jgi:pilus assembly protein CpaB
VSRRLIFFLFTAAVALVAAFLVHSALKSKEESIEALRQKTVVVVAATRDLSPGERIDASALKLISWPRDQVPPGAFTDFQAVAGRVAKTSLGVNQPILASALLEPEKTGGVLSLMIPPGMRAMSIAVDDVSDMAGFVLPYSRVDVLVSVALAGGPSAGPGAVGEVTKIVLQNIKVLAVAQTLEAGLDQPRQVKVVTLLVTPDQAERLAAASRLGTLGLAMRNFSDQQLSPTSGVTLPTLLGELPFEQLPPPPPVPPDHQQSVRPPRGKTVEVIRNGTDHETINFSANGRISSVASPAPSPSASADHETAPPIE